MEILEFFLCVEKKYVKKRSFSMLALRSYEKKNKDGFAAMTADELKFINGGASSKDYYRRDPSPTIAGKRR